MYIEINAKTGPDYSEFFKKNDRQDVSEDIDQKLGWLRHDSTAYIILPMPSISLLKSLRDFGKERGYRGLSMQMTSLIGMLESPNQSKIGNLRVLPEGLRRFLETDAIDGWLYLFNGHFNVPYLVTGLEYKEAEKGRNGNSTPAYVKMTLLANAATSSRSNDNIKVKTIMFDSYDIGGQTIPSMLLSKGLQHESPELKAEYEANNDLFIGYYAQSYKQFLITGLAFSSDHCDSIGKPLTEGGGVFKGINDEPLIERHFVDEISNAYWEGQGNSDFGRVPFHPFIYMYLLEAHEYSWVHVSSLKPYVYKPELRDKLILPDDHKDLIDILTSDLSLLEDVVDGKTGGTTILCTGAPGTGKTLTAEIYSEVIEKPLYRIHSGLLGTTPEEVEKQLKLILSRAERWQCCLLIDECDTWCRERGDDLDQNAIVASFLRSLEYYSSLLFLTSNRSDLDDAIVSRCIAHIHYEAPKGTQRQLLWETLSENYKAGMSAETIKAAIEQWPNAVGRDIKELLKLALKFASRAKAPVDLDNLKRCAQFRGLSRKQ